MGINSPGRAGRKVFQTSGHSIGSEGMRTSLGIENHDKGQQRPRRIIPGMMPAMNSFPMDTSTITP